MAVRDIVLDMSSALHANANAEFGTIACDIHYLWFQLADDNQQER